jgi:hypothetical protein
MESTEGLSIDKMSFLLIYISEGCIFDKERIKAFWQKCPHVCNLRDNAMVGASLDAEFIFAEDKIIMELKPDHETIVLSGAGLASIQMSFLLQSIHAEALHLIDDGYTFDLVIKNYESAEKLREAVFKGDNNIK